MSKFYLLSVCCGMTIFICCGLQTNSKTQKMSVDDSQESQVESNTRGNQNSKRLKWPSHKNFPCPRFCLCSATAITCHSKKLKIIPQFNDVENLKALTVHKTRVKNLGKDNLKKMFYLRKLQLSDNKLLRVDEQSLADQINLEQLDFSNNKLSTIGSNTFRRLVSLKELNLNKNQLHDIEGMLGFLSKLQNLLLSKNKIKSIGNKTFYGNSKVKLLDLSWNRITSVSKEAFTRMAALTTLLLNNNPIKYLDVHLGFNFFLEQLDVTRCRLKQVLKGTPRQLKDLRLTGNKIIGIDDDDFIDSNAIQLLLLNDNRLESLSDTAFDYMPLLHDLYINKNRLTRLPNYMPSKLYSLYASYNLISSISWRPFSKKYNLHHVVLSHNRIAHIDPNAMRNLVFLIYLDLSHNNLKYLRSGTFGRTRSLERLDLSHNPLHTVEPGCFMGLKRLHILKLSSVVGSPDMDVSVFSDFNKLLYLDLSNSSDLAANLLMEPSYGMHIESVKNLNIINTGLRYLPYEVRLNLQNLTTVKMTMNPWHCNERILWLKDWIRTSVIDFYEPEKLVCKSPAQLAERRIVDLTNHDVKTTKAANKRRNKTKAQELFRKRLQLLNKTLKKQIFYV